MSGIKNQYLANMARCLNFSYQLDNPRHNWGRLCNLLDESFDTGRLSDPDRHARRLKEDGFSNDSELCAYMSSILVSQARLYLKVATALTKRGFSLSSYDLNDEELRRV